ncbi:YicC/YloC family endoribonuclease [Sulfitobacter aestuariivivens]|uniref:YicC family protein n=1 Tax=Sulfitobacter aestuariivivens TaxID=2766981 RepID=A0A927D1B6_9RHOB|nr:YicC/YloC family endoribonuclease [Sulfitobacter aestuariivivens]MBD3663258.1 YicC family protein [Sulfitobacter aestuariivivens]
MIKSMTGFASASGADAPFSWGWELRSVNGKGLDLRLRVPDWIDGLEAALRKRLGAAAARGNVTCNLRLNREEGGSTLEVNKAQLSVILEALHQIEAQAMDAGVSLAPSKASDIVTMRGVLEQSTQEDDTDALRDTLLADFETVLADFDAMRASEGQALADVLDSQLAEVSRLTAEAAGIAETRKGDIAATLKRNLGRILENADGADETRIAQELALIAVKADVTEEIDRLTTHVAAARNLLGQGGPVGRKMDFLMQEFNREANTLCSKAQHAGLTAVGLALKAVIDQMREQVQNVE